MGKNYDKNFMRDTNYGMERDADVTNSELVLFLIKKKWGVWRGNELWSQSWWWRYQWKDERRSLQVSLVKDANSMITSTESN